MKITFADDAQFLEEGEVVILKEEIEALNEKVSELEEERNSSS